MQHNVDSIRIKQLAQGEGAPPKQKRPRYVQQHHEIVVAQRQYLQQLAVYQAAGNRAAITYLSLQHLDAMQHRLGGRE